MRSIKMLGLTVSALALLASPAFAQAPVKGFYVGMGAGATFPMDNEVESPAGLQTHKLSFDPGWLVDGQVGYAFGNGLRSEIEVGYRQAGTDTITNPYNNPALAASGQYKVLNTMLNVLYDMDINARVTPYIGLGVGYAHVWAKDLGIANSATGLLSGTDKDTGAFAYQGIAGFSVDIAPQWSANIDYRYLATTELDYGNLKSEYSSHNVMVGLRYAFNAPMAAAPIAAAPAAIPAPMPMAGPVATANTYMVFFDFDKSVITPEAQGILKAVAAEYKKGKTVKVDVTGHADRSGTDKYNDKLSVKRANAIKAYLGKLGVTSSAIVTKADGEKSPMVTTADGVREAQNRRGEIILGK